MTYTLPDGIEGEIDLACGWLRAIGLYVRRTAPIDWDNASKAGRNPTLIRGGTHVDEGEFRVVHNPFFIEACDNPPGYQARYPGPPGQGPIFEEQHFERFSEAVGFILSKWTPLVEGCRIDKREIQSELVKLVTPDARGNIPVITEMGFSVDQYLEVRRAILGEVSVKDTD